MGWQQQKYQETLEGLAEFFEDQIEEDPKRVMEKIDGELTNLYIRFDQDWTGRGVVGDTVQMATIAALERVRAKCLEQINQAI
jgi:RNA binding exosome subunit